MASVMFLLDDGGGGGTDYIPSALDWANISITNDTGVESNAAVTIAGIDMPITIRASWTSAPGATAPSQGYWIKNGTQVAARAATPVDLTCSVGDQVSWSTYAANSYPEGNDDSGTVTVTNESHKATVTMTIATPAVVSWTGHGLSTNAKVRFTTTGALPTNVTAGTVYFVIASGLTADAFQFSATQGGAAINTTGTQSGVHTCTSVLDTFTYACRYVNTGGGSGDEGEPPYPYNWFPV
jgi:hypothetical protein